MVVTMQPQDITKVSISALVISLPIIYVSLLRVPPSALARDSTFWFLISNSIIAIIAADSGMLFLGSASSQDDDDGDLPDVVTAEQPVVATVHEDYYHDTVSVPLMASSHEQQMVPVDIPGVVVVGGEHLPPIGAASCKATDSTGGMEQGHAPALTEREGAAGKPSTDTVVNHASVLQRSEEAAAAPELLEPVAANKKDAMIMEGDHCTASPAPPLIAVTADDDVPQDVEGYLVERGEVKPRCSVAEESKPPPRQEEEQREYWQLSDEELNRKVEEFIARFNRDMVEQEAAAV